MRGHLPSRGQSLRASFEKLHGVVNVLGQDNGRLTAGYVMP